jgi:hypothetical protein
VTNQRLRYIPAIRGRDNSKGEEERMPARGKHFNKEQRAAALPLVRQMRDEKSYSFKKIGRQFKKSQAWACALYNHGVPMVPTDEPMPVATSKPIALPKGTTLPPPIVPHSPAPPRKESVSLARALKYLSKEQLVDYILKSK